MTQASTTPSTLTIGIDLGDRKSHVCVLDAAGEIVEESRIAMTPKALRARFEGLAATRIALEVGTHSAWVSELLGELGHEVIVANARKLRMIFQSDSKNDRLDAEQLARVARMDPKLLYPIEHRERSARADLAVMRSRDALVATRTRLVNHIHGVLKSFGHRVKKYAAPGFHRQVAGQIPEELQPALQPLLDTLAAIAEQVLGLDREIRRLSTKVYPETALLNQVGGVGPITALRYVLTIEDPKRIERSRNVGAYLGLRPRQRQSGQRDPELRITKAGDRELRRLLVQCAQQILGPFGKDSDLRRWGLELASRGAATAKKKAVIAVARKLAVLLHRLWLTGEVYEPLRNTNRRAAAQTHEPAAVAV
ncbi:MAG: IS110 family transposase [Myxococcota bacterium]